MSQFDNKVVNGKTNLKGGLSNLFNLCLIVYLNKIDKGISLEPTLKEVECQGTLVPYNGGCSSMVERAVVASKFARQPVSIICERAYEIRKTRVRSSPSALFELNKKEETGE